MTLIELNTVDVAGNAGIDPDRSGTKSGSQANGFDKPRAGMSA